MSKVITLKKGLDIKLFGEANRKLTQLPVVHSYALRPDDFKGVIPKMLVNVDDPVKAGTPLFFDKYRPEILFVSPVSGKVQAVNRGEKRKILNVVIEAEANQQYEQFNVPKLASATREEIVQVMLRAGLWPMIIQRPYGRIADPKQTPRAIFVSGFDSAPLAPEMDFLMQGEEGNLAQGFEVLRKLTTGKVHLGLRMNQPDAWLNKVTDVERHYFKGPHPAGNIGVQIHYVDPINKGETVWTVDIQHVAMIGRFFRTGKVDLSKIIALTGSEIMETQYFSTITGAAMDSIVRKINICQQPEGHTVRIINGNVLTGRREELEGGHLGFYNNQLTVVPEGDHYEMFGWAMPRFNKFSVSHSYFSWLTPNRRYSLDTNTNGGHRALVMTGLYDRYLPMDIYPIYLIKAILAGDIDKMENLGIYEVIEEDLALCEFVDPSKTEIQEIICQGIDLMIKELN